MPAGRQARSSLKETMHEIHFHLFVASRISALGGVPFSERRRCAAGEHQYHWAVSATSATSAEVFRCRRGTDDPAAIRALSLLCRGRNNSRCRRGPVVEDAEVGAALAKQYQGHRHPS